MIGKTLGLGDKVFTKVLKYGMIIGIAYSMGYSKGLDSPRRLTTPLSQKTSYLDYTVKEIFQVSKSKIASQLEHFLSDNSEVNNNETRNSTN
tara:strand:+ start:496 stop:771 length:276 start_codon:yes stop_codon:yes gene_type:complete